MGQCILIVDDDPAVLDVLRLFLDAEGYDIVCAEDEVTALNCIQDRAFEALIADSLPALAGLKVVKAFCKKNPAGVVIFFTGLVRKDTYERAINAGANVVLFKPIGLDEVVSALRRMLAKTA